MRLKGRDQGLTLLELVIAVLVLALGSIAALRATDQSRVAIGGAQDRMLATLAATNRAEELKLLGTGIVLPQSVELGGQAIRIETDLDATLGGLVQVEIVAKSANGPGVRRVIFVPAGAP